jgi:hypothetical protein
MSTPVAFIEKWSLSGASEASNAQSFTNDLCDLIGVRNPDPTLPDERENTYVFEKSVPSTRGVKKIDCYRRGHFILENKQGAEALAAGPALSLKKQTEQKARKTGHGKRGSKTWDTAMEKAKKQAENYARLLPSEEIVSGRPPFILVADVGHSIAVYADWSRAGGHYQPFPDPNNYRIKLADLDREDIRARLRLIWTDPLSLDPSRRSAKVTKEIADRLARLAKSLDGASAEGDIAGFLMRCLFTMFAEDVGLLEDRAFTQLLENCQRKPIAFVPKITELWNKMNTGGYSVVLDAQIRRFNGGLFSDTTAVALNEDQIQLLLEAAEADWKEVEPAIFGTLLERALNPRERHKLGAHYTPRAYVERLVQPTILEPLRREWDGVQAAALSLTNDDKRPGHRRSRTLPAAARRPPCARPRLRQRQLPLRHPRTAQAAGGRGPQRPARTRPGADQHRPYWRHHHARKYARHRAQPARRQNRRTRPLDRLPPVAPPQHRRPQRHR